MLPGNLAHLWPRTQTVQRYSPLKQIDATNVGKLGLAWSAPSAKRAPKVFEFVLVILGRVWV